MANRRSVAMRKDLEAILDGLPAQPPRSRLDPYAELIDEMRRRNWTYRGIAQVLAEKCNLKISPSNIHHFVKLRHRLAENVQPATATTREVRGEPEAPSAVVPRYPPSPEKQQDNEIRKRIDGLKRRSASTDQDSKAFEFDPAEPLRLHQKR